MVQQKKPNLNFIIVIKNSSFNQSFVDTYLIYHLQTIFRVPRSECLLMLLAAVQLYDVLVLRPLDMKYSSFANVSIAA